MALPPLGTTLPFVQAHSFRQQRKAGAGDFWIVIHTTEGHDGAGSAENEAQFDAHRTDEVSTHRVCDRDSTVQCVADDFIAFAHSPVNDWGKALEICGTHTFTATDWHEPPGRLEQVAWNIADWWKQKIDRGLDPGPIRFLYAEDLVANMRQHGVTTHNEISRATGMPGQVADWMHATGQSASDHSDPGFGFYPDVEHRDAVNDTPLGFVIDLANRLLTPTKGDDMPTTLFQCINPDGQRWANAVFAGPLDSHGIAQWVENIDPATLNAYEGLGAQVINRAQSDGFSTIALFGPLPSNDIIAWDPSNFRRVVT